MTVPAESERCLHRDVEKRGGKKFSQFEILDLLAEDGQIVDSLQKSSAAFHPIEIYPDYPVSYSRFTEAYPQVLYFFNNGLGRKTKG